MWTLEAVHLQNQAYTQGITSLSSRIVHHWLLKTLHEDQEERRKEHESRDIGERQRL